MNWQKGSTTLNYLAARGRVKSVAEHLAKLIDFLVDKHMLDLKSLTIVGHSLGGHVAGLGDDISIIGLIKPAIR